MPASPATHDQLQDLMPFRFNEAQKGELTKAVTPEEIKTTLFAMPLNKSPGPDGFSVEFFRASWDVVGPDVIAAVQEFFRNGRLLKDLNNTAVALIPKVPEACRLGDYRPISCCNLIYKLISKIIANRMKPVLLKYIRPNQAAFIRGRSLGENVLLSTELIRNYEKSSCARSCMLKVDIRKAFDTVCWDFVLKMLNAHDFPPLFISWIRQCISTPRFSISVNGELAGFFPGKKGLRQCDSISPYLFIMVMEALSGLLDVAVEQRKIRLHPQCHDPKITHLLFADDLLIFSDGSRHSLTGIKEVMESFRGLCGLEMNPAKSEIFFGGYFDIEVAVLSGLVGFKVGSFPTRYLGLPLNPRRITLATLQPFIEKVTSKLQSWTSKTLSFAGKIRLVSSGIYGMVNFWSYVFSLPKMFYAKIDSLCAAFLWNNNTNSARGARVAWKDICRPKMEGGLGIRLLEDFEKVFRLKQIWNLYTNAGSLWVAWVNKYIFGRKGFWLTADSPCFSRAIRSMLQLKPILPEFLRCDLRNGETSSFWYDSWTDLGSLIDYMGSNGPRQLRIPKGAKVSRAVKDGSWSLPHTRSEEAQNLLIQLTTLSPPKKEDGPDSFLWVDPSGQFANDFSSKATWEKIRDSAPLVPWHGVIWFKQEIPRCSFISWLVMKKRLPTRDRLRAWGLGIPPECVLCSTGIESHDHLFFECDFSLTLWNSFTGQFQFSQPLTSDSVAMCIGNDPDLSRSSKGVVIRLLFQVVMYLVWKERNQRIFTPTSSSPTAVCAQVDRLIRDRLLSFPATATSSPSLLEVYFSLL
ncbi:unnamed protein product [Microthlaspi erraticum]|uniref:Reverse transcriptase domain-containing protein n=1 Tax=Microthlaspi erraticum TaxID=1685480 RepID=A0A6D2KVH3_9BRAS|nr:unnamed protein product [Microthlaspi erraticum]